MNMEIYLVLELESTPYFGKQNRSKLVTEVEDEGVDQVKKDKFVDVDGQFAEINIWRNILINERKVNVFEKRVVVD